MPHVYLLMSARVAAFGERLIGQRKLRHVHGSAVVIDVSSVYAHRPPTCFLRSNNVALKPSSRSVFSVDNPHVPIAVIS
jgi:hypothetical protein